MKYFLKMNTGTSCERINKKYIRIPLDKIKPDLYHNNNFQTICEYTMTFESENALKAELIHKGLLSKDDMYHHLGIGYTYNGVDYFLPAPYLTHKSFFDFNKLCNLISRKIEKNREFAIQFLFLIKDEKGLQPEHAYELKKYGQGFYQSFKPDPWVKDVLKDIIKRNGKTSYRSLYYIAMIAYKICSKSQIVRVDDTTNIKKDSQDGPVLHKELIEEDNSLDQLSLF